MHNGLKFKCASTYNLYRDVCIHSTKICVTLSYERTQVPLQYKISDLCMIQMYFNLSQKRRVTSLCADTRIKSRFARTIVIKIRNGPLLLSASALAYKSDRERETEETVKTLGFFVSAKTYLASSTRVRRSDSTD